jgi:hypothetical protein
VLIDELMGQHVVYVGNTTLESHKNIFHSLKWMDLDKIILSEISQMQKYKWHMLFSLMEVKNVIMNVD